MRSVPVNTSGTGNRGLAERNYLMRYEHKEVRDGVVGEGQGLSEEDESRINEVAKDVNEGPEGAVRAQAGLQPLSQGPEVHWERFLPLRSLKVLLVENDDSTRQIVSALLRNCSYEVTAVANGLQAWKILVDLTNQIDLILTEVFMPGLSGVGLLCKVMNHKTCKNIPVIMMSSHDAMGIVFKCLSKGAVDFLVKPIRKNELKNLWQHVWRRCHSSSGSGSESGIRSKKYAKSKSVEESDNNTGSNDGDDNTSIGLNVRDGSDNGSGTQSSWTKRAVEVDSPQPLLPWDQLADPPSSTCALVTQPNSESLGNKWAHIAAKKECQEQDDNVAMGKDLKIGAPRNPDLEHEYPCEKVCTNLIGAKQDKLPELDPEKDNEKLDNELLELNIDKPIGELRAQETDRTGLNTISSNPQVESRDSETFNGPSEIPEIKDKATSDAKELPSLELSLKRLRGIGDVGTITHDERNVLRHSDLSAFSRYNSASTANQAPTGNVGSCSPLGNSSDAMKTESMYNQRSNGSSNNNDVGSTTKNVFTKPAALNEKSSSTSAERYLHPSAFQTVQNSHTCPPQQVVPQKAEDAVVNTMVEQPGSAKQQVQVQHHHHHHHHYHHHVHNMKKQQTIPDHDDLSLNMGTTGLQCGSSNVFSGSNEGNTGNYSLNGSGSGSNHGSNKPNGSNIDVKAGGMNIESGDGVAGESGIGGGSGSGSGVDQSRFAQRAAALTKFRQKKKDRCFEKKVRYQSRKRLAEQRPRVRGQFVRQKVYDTSQEGDC